MIFGIYEYEFQGVEEWTSWWFQKILLLLNLIQDSGINHQPILRPSTAEGFEVPKWSLSNCQDAMNLDEKPEKVEPWETFSKTPMEKSQQVENQV